MSDLGRSGVHCGFSQQSTQSRMKATHEFHRPIPRRRDELVLIDVGPIDREDFAGVLLPGTDREILDVLARIEHDVRRRCANLP